MQQNSKKILLEIVLPKSLISIIIFKMIIQNISIVKRLSIEHFLLHMLSKKITLVFQILQMNYILFLKNFL